MVRDRKFYRTFFAMAIVLVLQNMVTISVNLADNLMLGSYSEVSLSAVAAVNQVQFVFQQVLMALGEGLVILGSQYFGKKEYLPLKKIASMAMHYALFVALVLFAVVTFFPAKVLAIFTTDAAIVEEGIRYLKLIRFTYVVFALTQLLLATLRSTGVVKIALKLSVISLIVNCCINYTLIYGRFGMPQMGVRGAAIGTLIARLTELTVLVIFIIRKENALSLRWKDYLQSDRLLRSDYIRITLPILFASATWGLNTAAQNAILGHMTARAIAANSVASTLFLLVKSAAIGMAATTAFFIGQMIGQDRMKELKLYSRTMQIMFVGVGILAGITLFFIRIPVLRLYHLEAATKQMANTFLCILSVIIVTMSYQMPTNMGIIKGGGDTRYAMILDLVSIWCVVLPISFVAAFVLKASPVAVVWCLNLDQFFKCIPAFIKVNFGNWARCVTR